MSKSLAVMLNPLSSLRGIQLSLYDSQLSLRKSSAISALSKSMPSTQLFIELFAAIQLFEDVQPF
jgi:hypothetical protein